jgi:hypothetical protein
MMETPFVTGTRKLTVDAKRFGAVSLLFIGGLLVPVAYADTWVEVTGSDTLRELVSGATATIEVDEDIRAVGKYFEDGTAKIEAWGETFDRTWEVQGDDQVCYSSLTEISCFSFERSQEQPNRYRVNNVKTRQFTYFEVEGDGDTVASAPASGAQEGGLAGPSASEIAAELSNPNSTLGTMNFNIDYLVYQGDLPGASDQSATRVTFQPALPYPISETTNFFFRPAFPVIIRQDIPAGLGSYDTAEFELGDISFDASLGKSLSGGNIIIGGLAGTLPTATDDDLGLDQWLLGPQLGYAKMAKWGIAGLLISHQRDVAGEDDFDTKITGGQYFYAFNMGNGWQINSGPTFSYNHEARDNDNKLTLPLGIGASKTVFISGRPWKFGAQYWHYIESPDDFGLDYQIRFSISPVVALPW